MRPFANKFGLAFGALDILQSTYKYEHDQITGYRWTYNVGTGLGAMAAAYYFGPYVGAGVSGMAYVGEKTWDHAIRPATWDFSGKMIEMRNALANGWPRRQLINR